MARPQPRRRTTRANDTQRRNAYAHTPTTRTAPRSNAQATRSNAQSPRPNGQPPRKGKFKRFMKWVGITILVLALLGAAGGTWLYFELKKSLPDTDIRKAMGRDQSSVITDRNGRVLTTLYAEQNRSDVALTDMPKTLRQAVIATEDKRFYEHEGVDPIGIARALAIDISTGTRAQGGSTITQQYIKQAFVGSEKTLKRKLQEAMMAVQLDKNYSKDEILELYLNTIYFGHASYGVQSAAETYFGKDVSKLTVEESALIAAVIKSPGLYSPYLHPDAALKRRNTVLALMRTQGMITEAEYQTAKNTPIKTAGLKEHKTKAPYFVSWVKKQAIEEIGESKLYRGGVRIKTTLDLNKQKEAEKAIKESLNKKSDPSASLVSLDPKTGQVLALVGGKNFETQQFNVATQGKRQPGSAFKTFVLTAALENGISPEKVYKTNARTFKTSSGPWKVTGSSRGPMSLREATARSINSVFAEVILDIGPEKVVETAHNMGITSELNANPAIALGGLTEGVSPLEMASAYGTLANGGTSAKPYGIIEITDAQGKTLVSNKPKLKEKAVDPAVAYMVNDILKGVISHGTGTSAKIGRPAAGKTGTTQAYRDAWFCGYTPELSTAVWVGYPSSQKEMTSVHGITVTGGSFPAAIWKSYMTAAVAGTDATDFTRPEGFKKYTLCEDTGLLATKWCPKTKTYYSLDGFDKGTCTKHKAPASKETSDTQEGAADVDGNETEN